MLDHSRRWQRVKGKKETDYTQIMPNSLTVNSVDLPYFLLTRLFVQLKSEGLRIGAKILIQGSKDDLHVLLIFTDHRHHGINGGGIVVHILQGDLQRPRTCGWRATYGKSDRHL